MYYKQNEKGVGIMCKIMEDLIKNEKEETQKETRKETQRVIALEMLKDSNLTYEKIARYSKLSMEEIETLAAEAGLQKE